MPKVKLTESELRKVVATILNEQEPDTGVKSDAKKLASEIELPMGASDQLDVAAIIRQDPLCSALGELASKMSGAGLIEQLPDNQTAYRYGRFTEKILDELEITANAITWNNRDPLAGVKAARQYMKLKVLSAALRKEFSLDADELNAVFSISFDETSQQTLYIIDPDIPATAYWPGIFAPGDAVANLECLKVILGTGVTTYHTISSAFFWQKLDDLAWVNAVNNGLKFTTTDSNPQGVTYCDHPTVTQKREDDLVKTFSTTVGAFNKTYNVINTSAFDAFFVTPLMYPSIWKVTKQEDSPLYDPWSMTLSACNMINNAIALPGGLAALAIKLTEASTKGISSKGLSASIEGFDPRKSDQYITLNESRKIMVTLPELRRIVQAAFSVVLTEDTQKSLRKSFKKSVLKEGSFTEFAFRKGLAVAGAVADVVTDARNAGTASASVAVDAVANYSDPNVTKHAGDLLKIIESLAPADVSRITSNLDSVVAKSYNVIFDALSVRYFVDANTLYTPKAGRSLVTVADADCVIDLSKFKRYTQLDPDALERVRLALNNAAAINVAQRANRGEAAAKYAESAKEALRTDTATAEKIRSILESITAPNTNQTASELFDNKTNILDTVVSETSIGKVEIVGALDPEKWAQASGAFAQNSTVAQLAGKLFTLKPGSNPDDLVALNNTTARFLDGKTSLNKITIDEINQSALAPALKTTILSVKTLLDQAVTASRPVIDETENVVSESRRAILKDAAEGASEGALSIARGFLNNASSALRAVVAGPQAKEGNTVMQIIDSLGEVKYDPEAASNVFDESPTITGPQRVRLYANALGRVVFFLDKGLSRATRTAVEEYAKSVANPRARKLAQGAAALLKYNYSSNVTKVFEKLEQVLKMSPWLSKTNWTKMWVAKSVTTACVTILLYSTGSVGPVWEAENPWMAGFANLLKTLNNPSVFATGLIDVAYDLVRAIQGSDDQLFTQEQLTALLNPSMPDLIISALNNLAVGADPEPGMFPDLLAAKPTGEESTLSNNVASAVGITAMAVGQVIGSIMNLATDVGRDQAAAAKASLDELNGSLETAITTLDAAQKTKRKLGGLDAGNQQYKNLEVMRLGIITKLIDKIKNSNYTPFSTLGYPVLNVSLTKDIKALNKSDIFYAVKNTDEMVALSFMIAGEGPIKPIMPGVAMPVSNLDSVIAQLKEAGVDVPDSVTGDTGAEDTARDPATDDAGQVPSPVPSNMEAQMIELSTRFEEISGKWQELLVKVEVQKQVDATQPAAAAAPAP